MPTYLYTQCRHMHTHTRTAEAAALDLERRGKGGGGITLQRLLKAYEMVLPKYHVSVILILGLGVAVVVLCVERMIVRDRGHSRPLLRACGSLHAWEDMAWGPCM